MNWLGSLYRILLFTVFVVAVGLTWVVMRGDGPQQRYQPSRSLDHPQLADVPMNFRPDGGWDSRLMMLSGWERARVPNAEGWLWPLGEGNGALTYNAQEFFADNPVRGGRHLGEDLNGIGGMDSDFGDPVYAVSRGLVVYSGEPSRGWGKVMVLAHRLPDGRIVQSLYGHVDEFYALTGSVVWRGQMLTRLGEAASSTAAHLHFELIESTFFEAGMAGYALGTLNRLPAEAWLSKRSRESNSRPDPMELVWRPQVRFLN